MKIITVIKRYQLLSVFLLLCVMSGSVFSQKQACSNCPFARKCATQTVEKAQEEKLTATPGVTKFTKEEAESAGLSLREADYWGPRGDAFVQCTLCPHRCVIPEGHRGRCRVRMNDGGTLRTLVYARPVALHVDPIEKKPLFHFHPGTPVFSLATAGCNLRCVFCQNWQISQAKPETARFTFLPPKDIVAAAEKNGCKSIAFTYTEPTIFFEYMRDAARLAHEKGIKNVWVTCGYIEEQPLRELCKYIDAANVDLKGFSDEFYSEYSSGTLAPVLRTLEILKEEDVWVEVTNLIIPGANDTPEEIRTLCTWVATELGKDVPLHFSRFHPDYKLRDRPPTPVKTLNMAVKIAKECGLNYVYTGNVAHEAYEDTVCPRCGKTLIKRRGYMVGEVNIKSNACAFCGASIAGRW